MGGGEARTKRNPNSQVLLNQGQQMLNMKFDGRNSREYFLNCTRPLLVNSI